MLLPTSRWCALSVIVLAAACGGTPEGQAGGNCRADGTCDNGLACAAGTCATCASGFKGDGKACADVDECLAANGGCSTDATCTNTPGSRNCACNEGFTGDGLTCTSGDACAADNGGCDDHATCANAAGGRTCTCHEGWTGDGTTCTDIDECATANGGCAEGAACTNSPGSHACACKDGYVGDGTTCTDIDECATANGGCDPKATCANTPGSYSCVCQDGYSGDGITCADVDECATANGACDPHATCANTAGSHSCACKNGFAGDGTTCTDVDECAADNGGCDPTATCENTEGGRTCLCGAGRVGDGTTCHEVASCTPWANTLTIVDTPAWMPVALDGVLSRTTDPCDATCLGKLAAHDDDFSDVLVCSAPTNPQLEAATDFSFTVPSPMSGHVTEATLKLVFSGQNVGNPATATAMRVDCVDPGGELLAPLVVPHWPDVPLDLGTTNRTNVITISPARFATDYAEVEVPPACFHTGGTKATFRVAASRGCLRFDDVELNVRNDAANVVPNTNPIEGYADRASVRPGGTIRFRVHAPQPTYTVEYLRLSMKASLDGAGMPVPPGILVTRSMAAPFTRTDGKVQNVPFDAWRNGAGWDVSFELAVPEDWPSGLYTARLAQASGDACSKYDVVFAVREKTPGETTDLAVLASTNTWVAYNDWGGASVYSYDVTDGSWRWTWPSTYPWSLGNPHFGSYARPNPGAAPDAMLPIGRGHLTSGELDLLGWLDEQGRRYALLTDRDVHDDWGAAPDRPILERYRTLIVSTHPEYWSGAMLDALASFLEHGGNVLYLGGNGLYWKVTLQGDEMEVRKDGTYHLHDATPGGLWRDLGRPASALLGIEMGANDDWYDHYGHFVAGPAGLLHPLLAGTGLTSEAPAFGLTSLNDERRGDVLRAGAVGWETDKVHDPHPANLVLLASGLLENGGSSGDMTWYDHRGGGEVFAAGSIRYGSSLLTDPATSRITANVLDRLHGNARSSYAVTAVSSTAGERCDSGNCLAKLQSVDGDFLTWTACTGSSYADDFGDPTAFTIDLPADAVGRPADAVLIGTSVIPTTARLDCLGPAGPVTVAPTLSISPATSPRTWRLPLPPACVTTGAPVQLLLKRTGDGCFGFDFVGLAVKSGDGVLTSVTGAGCDEGCVRDLSRDDGVYDHLLACSTESPQVPTEVTFAVDSVDGLREARLAMDAWTGLAETVAVSCVPPGASPVAIGGLSFAKAPGRRVLDVPSACFDPAGTVTLRLLRTGGFCPYTDFLRLSTVRELPQ